MSTYIASVWTPSSSDLDSRNVKDHSDPGTDDKVAICIVGKDTNDKLIYTEWFELDHKPHEFEDAEYHRRLEIYNQASQGAIAAPGARPGMTSQGVTMAAGMYYLNQERKHHDAANDFKGGSLGNYELKIKDVGTPVQVGLRLSGSDGWYCDWVDVFYSGHRYRAPFYCWFDEGVDGVLSESFKAIE